MVDPVGTAVIRALRGMTTYGPEGLLETVRFHLRRTEEQVTTADLVELVLAADVNDPVRVEFHVMLSRWDHADGADWIGDGAADYTEPGTSERRSDVLRRLGLEGESADRVNAAIPVEPSSISVIDEPTAAWGDWYTPERASERTFYWDAYRGVLERKGWSARSLASLDEASHEVVRRLADPARPEAYQSKGLVVGYVQSGKTANFTGVIAKAIDAGYRLVIVLTGTIELLRQQTQRRLDMELIGKENILGGIDPSNTERLAEVDYAIGDRDWADGKFLELGVQPGHGGPPLVRRLTGHHWDFRALRHGIDALDFRRGDTLVDPSRPVHDPANLYGTAVRIAVVKKNPKALGDLIKDLERIQTRAGEIPTLVVDDEADLASVNTLKDKRQQAQDQKDRTRINSLLSDLLGKLKRAQYVGYTATPFANVFVDPDDAEDVFPKDFIISLPEPEGYRGGKSFHDLDLAPEDERTLTNSNELAFVRDLVADPDDVPAWTAELQRALDTYVLTGAVKLWRDHLAGTQRHRHHTMLLHESVRMKEHERLAGEVAEVWRRSAYNAPRSLARLKELWAQDILPVSRERAEGEPVPEVFDDLVRWIGETVGRISRGADVGGINGGARPLVVVNGNKDSDYTQKGLDFQREDVWKILVGGAKLSRGFTVEGLTVSYYTRRSLAADTLMQMGRWFGYRPGYADLVRLFLGRSVPGPRKGTTVDLYKAFEGMVRDEEEFRQQLRAYQGRDADGTPRVTPRDVPPLVMQSVPWLRPTARNKMYNARLTLQGEGGQVKDFFQHPPRDPAVNEAHLRVMSPLLDLATGVGVFGTDQGGWYQARYGTADNETVLRALREHRWQENYSFAPTLSFFLRAEAEGTLRDWVVLVPILTGPQIAPRHVGDRTEGFGIQKRERRTGRIGAFSGSSPRQRPAMQIISGGVVLDENLTDAAGARNEHHRLAADLHRPGRGVILLTLAADAAGDVDPNDLPDPVPPSDIAILVSLAFPKDSAPSPCIGFSVVSTSDPKKAIVDRDLVDDANGASLAT